MNYILLDRIKIKTVPEPEDKGFEGLSNDAFLYMSAAFRQAERERERIR